MHAGRRPAGARSTCASSPPPTAISPRLVARGQVPRGPLLPAQRGADPRCRRCASGWTTSCRSPAHFLRRARGRPAPDGSGRRRRSDLLLRAPLAGQRARAAQRDRAGGGARAAARPRSPTTSTSCAGADAGARGRRRRPDLPDGGGPARGADDRRALREAGGNRAEAARRLGIHRQLLYAKARRYGLLAPDLSEERTPTVANGDSEGDDGPAHGRE